MAFMSALIDVKPTDKVLDYGCGMGVMMDFLSKKTEGRIFGYDKYDYFEGNAPENIRTEYFFRFTKVYFMHSLAHVPDPEYALENLKELLQDGAMVYVLTPNKTWLDLQDKKQYMPDPTVISHFSVMSLCHLFDSSGFDTVTTGQIGNECNWHHERIFAAFKLRK